MSWLDKLVGGAAAEPIEAVGNVLDKLFTSKEEKLTKQAILAKLAMEPSIAQIELNKIEASHRSLLVSGWRPFIGWVCGLGLANTFLLNPWIQWVTSNPGPTLPTDIIMELVIAMLGLAGYRTIEKTKGKAK